MHDTQAQRKARGAFFTPASISRFMADWALRSTADAVLKPSCGEASFLLAAGDRLHALGAGGLGDMQLHGIELHAQSAKAAAEIVGARGYSATIKTGDFFAVEPKPLYDAVLGNPPYIRYQDFSGAARARSLEAALKHGVRLTGLASSWAAFTIHASQFLKPGGRLGLVLPAELLAVNYAAEVRRFLLERFATIRLVMFEELVFPGVLEEVVLLLAEGEGPAPKFEVFQARNLDDLNQRDRQTWSWFTPERDGKWTPALLPGEGLEVYQKTTAADAFATVQAWGNTYLGAVTGDNQYFSLTADEVKDLGLRKKELKRISPPGSRHLRGLTFNEAAWKELEKNGKRCYLFYPNATEPSEEATRYINRGQRAGVQKAYKCRVRKPWWRVPIVRQPDILLTYMDHERPRLATNEAAVWHLNSLYGITLRDDFKALGRELLPLAFLNSVTLLGCEMVGRAYGGGLLKLKPKEADLIPVPSHAAVETVAKALRGIAAQVGLALRRDDLAAAVALVDRVLLIEHLGMTFEEIQSLREARKLLFTRRLTRGKSGRGEEN